MTIECTTVDFARMLVSIPQAVGTIAIDTSVLRRQCKDYLEGFNTASGRYYCNLCLSKLFLLQLQFQYRKR